MVGLRDFVVGARAAACRAKPVCLSTSEKRNISSKFTLASINHGECLAAASRIIAGNNSHSIHSGVTATSAMRIMQDDHSRKLGSLFVLKSNRAGHLARVEPRQHSNARHRPRSCASVEVVNPQSNRFDSAEVISSVMRTLAYIRMIGMAAALVAMGALGEAGTARALDANATTKTPDASPDDAFRAGRKLFYQGDKGAAVLELERAGERGHPGALYLLGRIYRNGEGVPANDQKAFDYFNQIANGHADDQPGSASAAFVASAFVALGSYYLTGIEHTAVKPNVDKAREIFTYAASYFGDADAQFNLGRIFLDPATADRDPRQAARWLTLAARKGHQGAQALLGQLLFLGDEAIPRRSVQGLMWLTVARTRAQGVMDDWIRDAQEQAFSVASEPERRQAVQLAQDWIAKNSAP